MFNDVRLLTSFFFVTMSGYLPAGADNDPDAPYNQSERQIDVTVSYTVSACTTMYVDGTEEPTINEIPYGYNLEDLFDEFKKLAKEALPKCPYDRRRKLQALMDACDNYAVDEYECIPE